MPPCLRLVSGSDEGEIRVWEPNASGAYRDRREIAKEAASSLVTALSPTSKASHFRERLRERLVGGGEGAVEEALIASEAEEIRRHAKNIRQLIGLPDGRVLTCAEDNTIVSWSLGGTKGSLTADAQFQGHSQRILAMVLGEGSRFATGGYDRSVRIWEVPDSDGKPLSATAHPGVHHAKLKMEGHTDSVNALAWLRDGRLASASDDKTIRIWKVVGGFHVCDTVLTGHNLGVSGLIAWRSEIEGGDGLVSTSRDATLRLWS